MPMYDYVCRSCAHKFEDIQSVSLRETSVCPACESTAAMVIRVAPRLDPRMGLDPGFPSAYAKWRVNAERRGRGADMTAANKTIQDESIDRDAHAVRKRLGETPVITS